MKKFFEVLMLGVFVLSLSAMAQASFENDVFDFKQGAFTFKTDYILSDFHLRVYNINGNILNPSAIKEFGFYKIADMTDNRTTLDGEPVWMHKIDDNGAVTINEKVTFHKGDTIGIYLKTDLHAKKANGQFGGVGGLNTFTTTDDAIDGAQAFKNNERPEKEDDGSVYFSLFLYNHDNKQSVYQYALIGEPSNGEGGGSNLGGQPLPGLLTTIALGGAAVAGISRKRKNRKA